MQVFLRLLIADRTLFPTYNNIAGVADLTGNWPGRMRYINAYRTTRDGRPVILIYLRYLDGKRLHEVYCIIPIITLRQDPSRKQRAAKHK